MSNQVINLNQVPSDPSLKDLLDYFKKEIKIELNCHHIGTIQSFNPINQTANVTINYTKTFVKYNFEDGFVRTQINYPIMADCPCIVLGGGNGNITFPISTGDECLLLCNDRDIDNWFSGSSNSPAGTPRTHSLTDCLVLVGVRSKNNVLSSYDTDAVKIGKGTTSIKLYDNRIETNVANSTVVVKQNNNSYEIDVGPNASFVIDEDKIIATLGPTGIIFTIDNAGKLSISNATGEFVAALISFLQTATAGGYPLIGNLAVLQSFQA